MTKSGRSSQDLHQRMLSQARPDAVPVGDVTVDGSGSGFRPTAKRAVGELVVGHQKTLYLRVTREPRALPCGSVLAVPR